MRSLHRWYLRRQQRQRRLVALVALPPHVPPITLDIRIEPDGTRAGGERDMALLRVADHVHDLQGRCIKIRYSSEHCTPAPPPPLDDTDALERWLDS